MTCISRLVLEVIYIPFIPQTLLGLLCLLCYSPFIFAYWHTNLNSSTTVGIPPKASQNSNTDAPSVAIRVVVRYKAVDSRVGLIHPGPLLVLNNPLYILLGHLTTSEMPWMPACNVIFNGLSLAIGSQYIDTRDESGTRFGSDWLLMVHLPMICHPRLPCIPPSEAIILAVNISKAFFPSTPRIWRLKLYMLVVETNTPFPTPGVRWNVGNKTPTLPHTHLKTWNT